MYHISIQGKVIGTFNHNEVLRALGDGTFSEADHYWKAGMIDWKTLKQFKTAEFTVRAQRPPTIPKVVAPQESKPTSGLEKFLGPFFLGVIITLLNDSLSTPRRGGRRRKSSWSSSKKERDYERYDSGD
jgi:hypothetical protein